MVRVDNFDGRVTDIRTRYTVIRALSGRESIVPNEMLITQRVENLSLADMKVLLSTTVQVAYGTDVRALQARVTEAVASVPRVLNDPAPACQLAEFAADGMNLNVNFWIADPENGQGNVRSGRQPRDPRPVRPRRHRDPVPAARDAPHRRRSRGGP